MTMNNRLIEIKSLHGTSLFPLPPVSYNLLLLRLRSVPAITINGLMKYEFLVGCCVSGEIPERESLWGVFVNDCVREHFFGHIAATGWHYSRIIHVTVKVGVRVSMERIISTLTFTTTLKTRYALSHPRLSLVQCTTGRWLSLSSVAVFSFYNDFLALCQIYSLYLFNPLIFLRAP